MEQLSKPGGTVLAVELRDLGAQLLGGAARVEVRAHGPDAEHEEQQQEGARTEAAGTVQARAQGYIRPGEKPFALTP